MRVRLTPKSARDSIEGVSRQADKKSYIGVRIRALPEKGGANRALEALLAKALNVAKRDVRVASGAKSRYKSVMVSGDPADLLERAAVLAGRAAKGE